MERTTLFETKWLRLCRIGHWDFVVRPQADQCVGVLAITKTQEIVLVEQERIPLQRRVVEIPAGIVGDESEFIGESLAETAKRELLEETGYRANDIRLLSISPTSAGMTSEMIHLFYTDDMTKVGMGGGLENESIVVYQIPLTKLREFLKEKEDQGIAVDMKIFAALAIAGIAI